MWTKAPPPYAELVLAKVDWLTVTAELQLNNPPPTAPELLPSTITVSPLVLMMIRFPWLVHRAVCVSYRLQACELVKIFM